MDLEFTCWEGSLQSGWSDPARPAEVIEVGLAAFDLLQDKVLDTFSSMVRPRLNPELSEYCTALLRIPQEDVYQFAPLPEVLGKIAGWYARIGTRNILTCSWGLVDRIYLTQDAERSGCRDPFFTVAHVDLRLLMTGALVPPLEVPLERDDVRAFLGLSVNRNRHRALDDAKDLAQFCRALREGPLSRDIKGKDKASKV